MEKKKTVTPVKDQGGHSPMDAFANHEDAQSFIAALRTSTLASTKPSQIMLQSKIYAVFDLASSAVFLHGEVEKGGVQ